MNQEEYYSDEDDEDDILEAYCVRCKQTVEIESPQAVWTRRGMPATRGECPDCGGTVFRMGRTAAHSKMNRPAAVQVAAKSRAKLSQDTAYINFAVEDEIVAVQIAADLEKMGIASWLHDADAAETDTTQWAGGVHPALTECARMVLLLSPSSLTSESTAAAWRFFKEKRKPILIALVETAEPPDAIRRSPRFDFSRDYKLAFRQMVQALSQ
jgi:DNA-directed RNA polymerase subunit RPC12/RpoP